MRTEDVLYFSPRFKFKDLDLDNREMLLTAFEDRFNGFYFRPIEILNTKQMGFAAGTLCIVTIDALARLALQIKNKCEKRIIDWLTKYVPEFSRQQIATMFYKSFRCGLVHEGRIKEASQFSYETNGLIGIDGQIMIVNPQILLKRTKNAFQTYLQQLRNDNQAFKAFRNFLKEDFRQETEKE